MHKLLRGLQFVVAITVLSAPCFAAETISLRVVSWNMESGDSDAEFLAGQMDEKENVDIWGLSEVDPQAFETFREGAEGDSGNFEVIPGSTGGGDRLAIIYNADRLELLGEDEITDIQLGSPNLRAPLVAHLRGRTTGIEFLFVVNHLLRGDGDDHDEERRVEQGQKLNDWAEAQVLPAIVVGDFNCDFDCQNGDAGDRAQLYDELIDGGALQWVRPVSLVRTQKSFNSVLDFVFVANPQAIPGWTGVSRILDREGDAVATAQTYGDNGDETDHRPVDAIFTVPAAETGPQPFRVIQPMNERVARAAPSRTAAGARPARESRDRDATLEEILSRLERMERELAELRRELRN